VTAGRATRKFGLSRMQFGPERHGREHSVKAKNSQSDFLAKTPWKRRATVRRSRSLGKGKEHSTPVCRLTRKLEEQRVGYRECLETENTRSPDFCSAWMRSRDHRFSESYRLLAGERSDFSVERSSFYLEKLYVRQCSQSLGSIR